MTDAFAELLQDAGVTVSECYVDVNFMEYDSVGEITVPEEAIPGRWICRMVDSSCQALTAKCMRAM